MGYILYLGILASGIWSKYRVRHVYPNIVEGSAYWAFKFDLDPNRMVDGS